MKTVLLLVLLAALPWCGSKAADPSPIPVETVGNVVVRVDKLKPESIACTPGLTVLTVLSQAGGEFFNPPRKVRLVRGSEVILLDVRKLRSHPADDLKLQPGDVVQIPETMF